MPSGFGRTGCEDARQRPAQVVARMHGEGGAIRLVEPGDEDQFLAHLDPAESVEEGWLDLDRGVRRPLVPLPRRLRRVDELRPNEADWMQRVHVVIEHD